jgi:hypothetical protein
MKLRQISIWIMAALLVIIAVWDIYAFLNEENSTFSVIITDWSFYSPWVPFLFGVLMGHWFFPAKRSEDRG